MCESGNSDCSCRSYTICIHKCWPARKHITRPHTFFVRWWVNMMHALPEFHIIIITATAHVIANDSYCGLCVCVHCICSPQHMRLLKQSISILEVYICICICLYTYIIHIATASRSIFRTSSSSSSLHRTARQYTRTHIEWWCAIMSMVSVRCRWPYRPSLGQHVSDDTSAVSTPDGRASLGGHIWFKKRRGEKTAHAPHGRWQIILFFARDFLYGYSLRVSSCPLTTTRTEPTHTRWWWLQMCV